MQTKQMQLSEDQMVEETRDSRRDAGKRAQNHRPVRVVLHPQADAEFLLAQQRYTDANLPLGRRFYAQGLAR